MRNDTPHYSMFLMSGIIPWNFFAGTLTGTVTVVFDNGEIIKKVPNDRIIFVLSSIFFQAFIYCMNLVVILVAMPIAHLPYTWTMLMIIPGSILMTLFATGLVLILATLNVYFMDTKHLLDILVMFWFWLTPVVYASNVIPSRYARIMLLNPMANILEIFRSAVLGYPEPTRLYITGIETILVLFLGLLVFYRTQKKFAEIL